MLHGQFGYSMAFLTEGIGSLNDENNINASSDKEDKTLYPIGIQSFETIRKEGYAYVDKTGHLLTLPKCTQVEGAVMLLSAWAIK